MLRRSFGKMLTRLLRSPCEAILWAHSKTECWHNCFFSRPAAPLSAYFFVHLFYCNFQWVMIWETHLEKLGAHVRVPMSSHAVAKTWSRRFVMLCAILDFSSFACPMEHNISNTTKDSFCSHRGYTVQVNYCMLVYVPTGTESFFLNSIQSEACQWSPIYSTQKYQFARRERIDVTDILHSFAHPNRSNSRIVESSLCSFHKNGNSTQFVFTVTMLRVTFFCIGCGTIHGFDITCACERPHGRSTAYTPLARVRTGGELCLRYTSTSCFSVCDVHI